MRRAARSSTACLSCARRKRRCDGKVPCSLCANRGLECRYAPHLDGRRTGNRRALDDVYARLDALEKRESTQREISLARRDVNTVNQAIETGLEVQLQLLPPAVTDTLSFRLRVGKGGELEFRGPTSSVIGDSLPQIQAAPEDDSRYSCADLPDRDVMLQHLEVFAEWQNSCILILPGAWIDHLLMDYPPAFDDTKRRVVLHAVLSLTSRMFRSATTSYEERTLHSEAAFELALTKLHCLFPRTPCLEVAQAACILACREYACGNENSAWSMNGIASTVGTSIGLHAGRQYAEWIASGKLSPLAAEARFIAYWASVLVDRMLGSCLGTNCLIHDLDYDTPEIQIAHLAVPANDQGADRTALVEGSKSYVDSVMTTLRFATDFWKLKDVILGSIYPFRHDLAAPGKTAEEMKALRDSVCSKIWEGNARVQAWVEGAPTYSKLSCSGPLPHVLMLQMAVENLQILINRPMMHMAKRELRSPGHASSKSPADTAMHICRNSAKEILRLCNLYNEHYTIECSAFVLVHFLTNASSIFANDAACTDRNAAVPGSENLTQCIILLEKIGHAWEAGQKAIALIRQMRRELGNTGAEENDGQYSAGFTDTQLDHLPETSHALDDLNFDSLDAHFTARDLDAWNFGLNLPPDWPSCSLG